VAEVTLVRCYVSDCTVPMCGVVPVDEPRYPAPRGADIHERHTRIRGAIFERSKKRFGVGIVVGDVRATKGWHNTEPMQCRDHGVAAHRRTIVRVQHEATYVEVIVAADLRNEFCGDDCGFSGGNLPTDDATAPDIHNQVKVEIRTTHDCR